MKRITKPATFLLLVALGVTFAGWMISDPSSASKRAVLLRQRDRQTPANAVITFDFVNNGRSPIMCPDSWYFEFEDGTTRSLSLAPSGDVRVNPWSTTTVSIPKLATTKPWRLGASYYDEDVVFDAKVRIDQLPLKHYLPSSASSVRSRIAVSDWID